MNKQVYNTPVFECEKLVTDFLMNSMDPTWNDGKETFFNASNLFGDM